MGQPKYTIYKYVRLKDGSWRYCRAALYGNHTIKADVVIVGHREEKHSEGNYYLASGGQWVPAGADALAAKRQRHALLSGQGGWRPELLKNGIDSQTGAFLTAKPRKA